MSRPATPPASPARGLRQAWRRAVAWAGVIAVAVVAASAPAASGAAPTRLAGVIDWTERLDETWPWSGAWLYPVGDSLDMERPVGGTPAYRVNRGLTPASAGASGHDGVDLANGRAGGRVRAAAHGVVACVHARPRGGYGVHVVIAHRLDDGRLVYSVYSHLARRSVRVHEGSVVHAGQTIARVGQTGRATTPHLHFEVRLPGDSTLRWEKCPVTDPVEFVRERLPAARPDTAWSSCYMTWAELGALLPPGLAADARADAAALRSMVEHAASGGRLDGLDEVLGNSTPGGPPGIGATSAVTWTQVARALDWLEPRSGRLSPCPAPPAAHRQSCESRLGQRRPSRACDALARLPGPPTLAEVCLALADLAPTPPSRAR